MTVTVIAEAGINHNGEVATALALVDVAADAGCDAVKFQLRTPELAVPPDQWDVERDTPWGRMRYIDYKARIELDDDALERIDRHARRRGIAWSASCWDEPSVDRLAKFDPPWIKIASACLTDDDLLTYTADVGRPVILSTGMSTETQIRHAVDILARAASNVAWRTSPPTATPGLTIMHSTSAYPCPPAELNLRMITTLLDRWGEMHEVGYSGHETGLATTIAAVALGATVIERHITLDRSMWGTDQAASVEPNGLRRLVRDIRVLEEALGDGQKRVYDSELAAMAKLRRR